MRQVTLLIWWTVPAFAASNAALIESLAGTASTNHSRRVSSLDWLGEGAVLRTGAKSSALVILLNGRRFELGANSRTTIGPTQLWNSSGQVRELPSLPPMPRVAPLRGGGDALAATRFRGATRIKELCPREGMVVLPEAAILSFHPVDRAIAYEVVLDDENGVPVVRERTSSTEISAPQLQPATHYSWRVRALTKAGVIAEDEASFVTLSIEQVQTRQAFVNATAQNLALLAEIDFESALIREALDGFRAALNMNPSDKAAKRGLARVNSALAGK